MNQEDFKNMFGFDKPPHNDEESNGSCLILHCLKGKRAVDAFSKLALLGLQKTVGVYGGSFEDWKKRGGAIIKAISAEELVEGIRSKSLTVIDVRDTSEATKVDFGPNHIHISSKFEICKNLHTLMKFSIILKYAFCSHGVVKCN